nr:transcriptional regulator crz1 [Quercus suber]
MADTARATTSRTEPFPPLDAGPPATVTAPDLVPAPPTINVVADDDSTPSHSTPATSHVPGAAHLSVKSAKESLPGAAALQLTGQAAMADLKRRNKQKAAEEARQTSPNPQVEAMQTLMGGAAQSRASDGSDSDKLSEPMRRVAEQITVPTITSDEPLQASPTSLTSFGTLESNGADVAMTATAGGSLNSATAAHATQRTDGATYSENNGHLGVATEDGDKAFSYPGPSQPDRGQANGPSRGMSHPGFGQDSPKSSASNKRHKCPYCSTDFTRHHNLKSHLLTHSQEKPYVCSTCQARFRRLHDLKRHSKLHTGERPHTCDKCGRKFARGDALARHNKGPGGCAGRRSSFPGDDDYNGDGTDHMDGLEYGGDEDDDDENHGRRVSEPSRKRTHLETPQDTAREVYRQHSSTYPGSSHARPHGSSLSSMGPPQVNPHHAQGPLASPRELSGYPDPTNPTSSMSSVHYGNPGQVLNHSSMIESPKPLSPGHPPEQHRLSVGDASMSSIRNRSPSLTTQFQQTHFGRGTGGRTPPQSTPQFGSNQQHTSVLPPLQHPNQLQGRSGLQPSAMTANHGSSMLHHQQPAPALTSGGVQGANAGSLSSHGKSSGGSMRDIVGQDVDIWTYVRTLEQRFSRMQDEYELRISRLQEEVISLKGQVSNGGSYSSEINQRY